MPVVSVVSIFVVLVAAVTILGSTSRSKTTIQFPTSWDNRVQFAVGFIEQEKGKAFQHPVTVDFVPEAQFKQEASGASKPLSDKQKADKKKAQDQQTGELRALGLVQGNLDMGKETANLTGEGTAAYYDPKTKQIRVRGTDLSLAVKGTIVHEMTHAWQDQYYDLERLKQLPTMQEQDAFRTLAEGDAANVEKAWVDKLSTQDHATYKQQSKKDSDIAVAGTKTVPDVLLASFGAPYEFGPSFMSGLKAKGGQKLLDDTWTKPPVADHQILNPWDYLNGGAPQKVAKPETGGPESIDDGMFGSLFWYLALADRLEPQVALKAADAWGGDSYVAFEESGAVCVKARIVGGGAIEKATLTQAFIEWGKTLPQTQVTPVADGVDIRACDPGAAADFAYKGRASKTIGFPAVRLIVWAQRLTEGDTDEKARCLSTEFVRAMTLVDFEKSPVPDSRLAELRTSATVACPT